MTRDQSDYDFLVSEYGKTQNRIRDLEEENNKLREENQMLRVQKDFFKQVSFAVRYGINNRENTR